MQFNYTIPGGVSSSPTVGDIDRNQRQDIVVGSNNNILYVFMYPPYLHWEYYFEDSNVVASPIVSDYDLDNTLEILAFSDDGTISALKQTTYRGEQPRPRKCNSTVLKNASCYRDEYKYTTYVSELNSSVATNYSMSSARSRVLVLTATPALVNINKKTRPEIIIASLDGRVYILDTQDARDNMIVGSYTTEGALESSPAVADFDNDGLKDIVVGSNDKKLYIVDVNETNITGLDNLTYNYLRTRARWVYPSSGAIRSSPAIADLDSNLALEVVVGSDDGNVYVLGDRFKWIKQIAYSQYKKAAELYDKYKVSEVESYLNRSRDLYIEINDNEGLDRINFLQKRIAGDRLLAKAEDYYNRTEYLNATELVQKAALVYRYINDGRGLLKVQEFLNRIQVDSMIKEVEYYTSIGDYENATRLAEMASNYSNATKYGGGVNKTTAVVQNVEKTILATKSYIGALERYSKNKNSTEVHSILEKARALYVEINSTEGIRSVDRLSDLMSADGFYETAVQAYNKSEYKNASDSALKALDLYSKINQTESMTAAQQLAEKASLYVKASKFYTDAETYYLATDFITAIQLSRDARESYARIPDNTEVLRAEALLNKSLEAYDVQNRVELPFTAKVFIAFLLIISALRLRVVWYKHGKPGPVEISQSISQLPQRIKEDWKQKREEAEYYKRFKKPVWTSLSEQKMQEHGRPEHPMRWFRRNLKRSHNNLKKLSDSKPSLSRKLPQDDESLAKKLDDEVTKG
jgi:hypothetical protein